MLPISTHIISDDFELFKKVVNMGIDSRLTAFTKSVFFLGSDGNRFFFNFDDSELGILISRLLEVDTDEADLWVFDIVEAAYGYNVNNL